MVSKSIGIGRGNGGRCGRFPVSGSVSVRVSASLYLRSFRLLRILSPRSKECLPSLDTLRQYDLETVKRSDLNRVARKCAATYTARGAALGSWLNARKQSNGMVRKSVILFAVRTSRRSGLANSGVPSWGLRIVTRVVAKR